MTEDSATVVAMRQLVTEVGRPASGLSRSRRHALERLAALAERRAAQGPGAGRHGGAAVSDGGEPGAPGPADGGETASARPGTMNRTTEEELTAGA